MVKTFATNSDNDLFLGGDGNIAVLQALQAVVNAVKNYSLAQLGEEVLAIGSGLPNFQALWIGTPQYAVYRSYLRSTILSVPGVTQVGEIDMQMVGNAFRYVAPINTQFGNAEVTNG